MPTIPKAVREQSWILHCGKRFENKCSISWCSNIMTVFSFHCGHNVPHSSGGSIELNNLIPICSNCNIGMGDRYTITQWNSMYKRKSLFCWPFSMTCIKEPDS
jgi:hypothetical protein